MVNDRAGLGLALVEAFPLDAAEACVYGAALRVGFVFSVPTGNAGFAELPAEEDDGAFELAGEGEETFFEVGDLNADSVDLGEGIVGLFDGALALGAAAGRRPLRRRACLRRGRCAG